MDDEKKKMLSRGIVFGLVILAAVFYFLWGNYLNRGYLNIIADAPFEVEVFGGQKVICENSPCRFKEKIGEKNLIISKDGFKSALIEVDVRLFRTQDLKVEFGINPYLAKTSQIPEQDSPTAFKISYNQETKNYELIKAADPLSRPIVFFAKQIKKPRIFGSEKTALIIGEVGQSQIYYRIDLIEKTREQIPSLNLKYIENGTWSSDGKYFAFTMSNSDRVYILDNENNLHELDLYKKFTTFAWAEDSLVFITGQETTETEIFSSLSALGYSIGEYRPEKHTYSRIEFTSELSSLPEVLIPATNGYIIYFQVGEDKYELILK